MPSSIWYLPYYIIISTRLMFYERRLGLCVIEAMLKYMQLAGSGLVKSVLQLLIDGNKHKKCVK